MWQPYYADPLTSEEAIAFRIAETASKGDERKTFRELVAYAKKNAGFLDGLLFYKVDRAARNLFDYVELERLESEYDLPFISVSQPTENTPAGRMMRRTLANMASFYTEQQSVDVREGLARRVQEGWFVGLVPTATATSARMVGAWLRLIPGRSERQTHLPSLRLRKPDTLDGVVERINAEGRVFRDVAAEVPAKLGPQHPEGPGLHRRNSPQGPVVSRQA